MKKPNFAKVSPFVVDPQPIEDAFNLTPEDFAGTTMEVRYCKYH